MKKLLLLTLTALNFSAFGQMHVDTFYQNKSEYLIYSIIQEFDSMPQDVLNTKIKNWGGTHFINLSQVLVGETKEQFVFNYITETFNMKTLGMKTILPWYIRMVVQTKDNKIKVSLYDDGNCFRPGSYSGGISVPAVSARQYRFSDYFGKKGTCLKMYNEGFESTKESCKNTVLDLISYIKSSNVKKADDGW